MQSKYSAMLRFGFDRFHLRPLSVCTRSQDLKPQMRHNEYEFPATSFEVVVVVVLVLVLVLDLKLSINYCNTGYNDWYYNILSFSLVLILKRKGL